MNTLFIIAANLDAALEKVISPDVLQTLIHLQNKTNTITDKTKEHVLPYALATPKKNQYEICKY